MRRRGRSAWTVAAALALAASVLVPGAGAPSATAAPVTGFDAGHIISDVIFYDWQRMSAGEIDQFVRAQGAACVPAAGSTCLKDYVETTPTRPASALCPRTYTGASRESAATIVAKAAVACGINPQVLLVMLQKEQGLLTAPTGRPAATYARALGLSCPDTAPCDPRYAGFANQVYSAAERFQTYRTYPSRYNHQAGTWNQVRYHPDPTCGSSLVLIRNQATASLYNYTPYQPNAAALAAGSGTGDRCSSYGNRNFHRYFTQWFGSAVQQQPIGHLDRVTAAGPTSVRVTGWALDPDVTTSVAVHVYVDGRATQALSATGYRPDVGRLHGMGDAHGFDAVVAASPGVRSVCLYALDANGGRANTLLGCRSVTLTNERPVGALDAVTATGPGTVAVQGWAFDPDTSAPITVHVYVDGRAVRSVTASTSRPDVGRVHGRGANHGYDVSVGLAAGVHTVCVYAIDSSGGSNPRLGCREVDVGNEPPRGALDLVEPAGPGAFRVRGWAFDPDTSAPISVHVRVDGRAVRALTAQHPRPDVARVFGRSPNHGYDAVVATTGGRHTVCMYAIDAAGGANPLIGCREVDVPNSPPEGAVDGVDASVGSAVPGSTRTGAVRATGWAYDHDATTPVTVRLLLDGVERQRSTAGRTRDDGTALPSPTSGFALEASAAPGVRTVCVEALDVGPSVWSSLGCHEVTVPTAAPVGSVDLVTGTDGGVRVRGWAMDPDTRGPVSVHAYVDGRLVSGFLSSAPRPDVERVYGNGPDHGFDTTIPTEAGSRRVCLYAIDWPGGPNPLLGCSTVTVS